MKNEIVRAQQRLVPNETIPAKYYHVMGEAALSCLMLRRGMPKVLATPIVVMAANAYRTGALCKEIKSEYIVKTAMNLDLETLFARYKEIGIDESDGMKCVKDTPERLVEACKMYMSFQFGHRHFPDEELRRRVTFKVARGDAMQMLMASPIYKKLNSCQGPQVSLDIRPFLRDNGLSGKSNPCPPELNKTRCENARSILDTWEVDYKWTEAQHLLGLDFSAKNCKPMKSDAEIEDAACKIMGSGNRETTDDPTNTTGSSK